jgi:hypothetical protein
MELARAWIEGSGQVALARLLRGDERLGDLTIRRAVAEAQIGFDEWRGGRRNHDLLVHGTVTSGPLVIGLEAKADESFGQTVGAYARAAFRKHTAGEPTNAPKRIASLLADVAGTSLEQRPEFAALRYQLFTGIAGTLAAAADGERAAFVIHEFHTSKTTSRKISANAEALKSFMYLVFGVQVPTSDRWVVGPFRVAARRWSTTPLWVARLATARS